MAEPSSVRRKSGWNSLPTEVIKLIVSRVDNLSTMPLVACSSGLYRLLKALRLELFKPAPCLLMPPDLQKRRVTQHNDRRVASINPLDCDPIPVSLNYINGMYWVGMNTSWMVLVDGRGSWMLVEVYTRRLIPLPSINTALLWHRGPEYSESYSSQHDTKFDLLKVVICQVPTRSANYKDFRLIAFFNRGLAYLTGHCGKWINLHVHRRIIHPPWFSDAIEHKGFIYAVDSFYGWTYCWPTPVIATNGCYSSMLLSYDIMMACLYYCQHLLKKYSCS